MLSEPLYKQLSHTLIRKITTGEWQPGYKLPSENQLHIKYHLSRVTIRKALSELVMDKYIISYQGKGYFVRNDIKPLINFHFYNVYQTIIDLGAVPKIKLAKFELIVDGSHAHARQILHLTSDDYMYRIQYITSANDEDVFFDTIYLPYLRFPNILHKELQHTYLIHLLRQKYHFNGTFRTTSHAIKRRRPSRSQAEEAVCVETTAEESTIHEDNRCALYSKAYSFGKLMHYLKKNR